MNEEILNRKGARIVIDVPLLIIQLLNAGKIETVNLTEWLAVDHLKLIASTFPEIGIEQDTIEMITAELKKQKKNSAMTSIKLIGQMLHQLCSKTNRLRSILNSLSSHQSDSIRCYAPYLIALNEELNIEEKLTQSKSLISDKHFGVREVVWMALRPEVDIHLKKSIEILCEWTKDKDENIRRFTTEVTRPRGVWCKHIEQFKKEPQLALPILNYLKADESKYVQDSVGNWLNDTSKSKPDFVISICERWKRESPTKQIEKIIKRAKRTIDKK